MDIIVFVGNSNVQCDYLAETEPQIENLFYAPAWLI